MNGYTLAELLAQRQNAVAFGVPTGEIEVEIAHLVEQESMAARLRHPSSRTFRPFDQDQD